MVSLLAQLRKCRAIRHAGNRDRQGVTSADQDRRMNILLDCAWCGDEVVFTVDETDDELVCSACNTRMDFAPDPATTYGLLYETAQAA
jgi:DNA-directed RNA polymerase subunit RPC12/RpoP